MAKNEKLNELKEALVEDLLDRVQNGEDDGEGGKVPCSAQVLSVARGVLKDFQEELGEEALLIGQQLDSRLAAHQKSQKPN